MKQRIISALIAIPLFISMLLLAPVGLFKLFWLATLGLTAYEAGKMFDFALRPSNLWMYVGLNGLLSAALLFFFPLTAAATGILYIGALLWLLAVPYVLKTYRFQVLSKGRDRYFALLCLIFHLAFAVAVMRVYQAVAGIGLLTLLVLIWASDAGAYFIGRQIGKTPFSPQISPNKTWEGFVGGLLLAALCTLLWLFCFSDHPLLQSFSAKILFFVSSLAALVYAALGDLYESLLKRRAGVKDSGRIMPGHGGVYDRIDSWLPAIVIWALTFEWLRII